MVSSYIFLIAEIFLNSKNFLDMTAGIFNSNMINKYSILSLILIIIKLKIFWNPELKS